MRKLQLYCMVVTVVVTVVVVVVVVVRQNNQGNPAFDQQIREASGQVYDDG